MYVLMLNRSINLMSNYDHRRIYPRPFKFRFLVPLVPFLRFLICATAKFERTIVFGRLKTTFSVCSFSGSLGDALIRNALGPPNVDAVSWPITVKKTYWLQLDRQSL
jgi:hypothetical protein